jgi:thiol-disulfide isomerase/thioredoxin
MKPAFSSSEDPDVPPQARSSPWLWLVLVALAAVALFYVSRGPRERGSGTDHPAIGKAPTRWKLAPLTGDAPALDLAALQGKVTLVNFWGTWCPPCMEEFPHVTALWDELKSNPDFQMAAVSCDSGPEKNIDELRTRTAEYLQAAGTKMPTYYDPDGISRIATMDTTGEQLGFPTTILFDRQGKIRALWRGYYPGVEKEVGEATRQLLSAK